MFGGDNDSTTAVQKESYGNRKPKKSYENDFGTLRKARIEQSALDPTVEDNSTGGMARRRLRRILKEGGYRFGEDEKKAGFQFGDD